MKLLPRTQDHLDIIDIRDDILVLTGGRFRLVVEATAINFELLSEDEQNATIYAYANLVNSIDYPIQIVIRTRNVDVSSYIEYLESILHEQPSSALREQLQDYMHFIKTLVVENTVLSKRFFLVIPYLSASAATLAQSSKRKQSTTYSERTFKKAKEVLAQKLSDLKWQFNRLGIKVRQLTTEELVRLFYEIYNPEAGKNDAINQDIFGYTTPMVKSSLPPIEIQDEPKPQEQTQSQDQTPQPIEDNSSKKEPLNKQAVNVNTNASEQHISKTRDDQ